MKRKYIRTLILIGVVTAFSITSISSAPNDNGSRAYTVQKESSVKAAESEKPTKDETVYGILNYDGTVGSVYVVNHFNMLHNGVCTDYGDYTKVENLSNDVKMEVEGDAIKWDLEKPFRGFYYKGELKAKELPWNFEIKYMLNGVEIDADTLAGKNGKVEIAIAISPDKRAQAYFRDNYAMQIQVPVNMENSKIVSAEGATRIITGKTATLAYTVLPGTSQTYKITLEAESFEMDSISIGVSAADYSSAINTGEITNGFNSLSSGMGELISGTSMLKDGMLKLTGGINDISEGQGQLTRKGSVLIQGMEDYYKGLKEFSSSTNPLAEGSEKINEGISQIAANGDAVAGGYKQVADAIKAQLPSEEQKAQLQALSKYAGSSDPTTAQMGNMAKSMLEQITGIEQLYSALDTLNSGLAQYTSGVSGIAAEYRDFHNGISQLSAAAGELSNGYSALLNGNKQFVSGLSSINTGMAALNKEAKVIPDNVQKIVDGQEKIKGGIDQAEDSIGKMLGDGSKENKIVSFASPEKGSVNSVQFIIRTPDITVSEKKLDVQEKNVERRGFIEKLIELFKSK